MRANKQAGFTLVETAISLVVTSVVVGVLISFVLDNMVTYSVTSTRAALLNQAHLGLRVFNEAVLPAVADQNNRIADSNGPGAPGNLFGWTSDADTLVLATAAENSSGNILFQDAANYVSHKNNVIFYLSNGKVKVRTLAANVAGNKAKTSCPIASGSCPADRTILENVTGFNVKYYNDQNQEVVPDEARSVEVAVTLSEKKFKNNVKVDYTTRTVFRND